MRREFNLNEAAIFKKTRNGEYLNLTDFDIEDSYYVRHIHESIVKFKGHASELLLVIDYGLPTEQVVETSREALLKMAKNNRLLNRVPDSVKDIVLVNYLHNKDYYTFHKWVLMPDGSLGIKEKKNEKTTWEVECPCPAKSVAI